MIFSFSFSSSPSLSPISSSPSMADYDAPQAASGGDYFTEVKLFGRWAYDDVEVKDISLDDYIAVKPKQATFLPHTAGRYAAKRFRKAQVKIPASLSIHRDS